MNSSSNATFIIGETSGSNRGNKQTRGSHTRESQIIKQEVNTGYEGENKNWGSQIFFNNQWIWLGTFNSEKEAGMAYNSAALKLWNGNYNFNRSFPWTNVTVHELSFQKWFTNEAVLNMIRDGSYPSRLANYINTHMKTQQVLRPPHSLDLAGGRFAIKLFQKELTPSDVGRLKPLMIPKKHVSNFFPPVPTHEMGQNEKVNELTFYGESATIWKFKYCYQKTSQSYALTHGWNEFVSAHDLRGGDVVTFWLCRQPLNKVSVIYAIRATHKNKRQIRNSVASAVDNNKLIGSSGVEGINGKSSVDEDGSLEMKKGFKLFGFQIS